jgi:putative ABC transport system ATP-binding protein
MSATTEKIARPPVIEMLDAAVSAARQPDMAVMEDVNWRVLLDDFWVIAGTPGSGKSDLLATAAGLQRPLRGAHRLFGLELASLGEAERLRERLRVGVVFEGGARPFPQLTVADNVALPLCYHRQGSEADIRQRVGEVLEATGLSEVADRLPAQLVRSLHPRVGLARALALAPEVLLLDNPLAGLDPRQMRWWLEFIGSLAAGHAILKNRKMTLVVACDHLRPWMSPGRQFALVKDQQLLPLGGRAELERCNEPLLRELVAAEFTPD